MEAETNHISLRVRLYRLTDQLYNACYPIPEKNRLILEGRVKSLRTQVEQDKERLRDIWPPILFLRVSTYDWGMPFASSHAVRVSLLIPSSPKKNSRPKVTSKAPIRAELEELPKPPSTIGSDAHANIEPPSIPPKDAVADHPKGGGGGGGGGDNEAALSTWYLSESDDSDDFCVGDAWAYVYKGKRGGV